MISSKLPELMESLQRLDRSDKRKIFIMLADDLSIDIHEQFENGRPAMLPLIRAPKSAVSVVETMEREAQTNG